MIQCLILALMAWNVTLAATLNAPTSSTDLVVHSSATVATNFVGFLEGSLFHPNGVWPYLFKIYNYGILSVMIFMIAFSVLYGAAMMASDGSGFSRKINAWVYIRSLGGMAMLVPFGSNEFAAIQYLVLKIVWWSVWLTSYVFSGTIIALPAASDTMLIRLENTAIQEGYTGMTSMAACALSHAPEGIYYDSTSSTIPRNLNFRWTAASGGSNAGYSFVGLPCGRIEASIANAKYDIVMESIIRGLRSVAQPIIYNAQRIYDQNVRAANTASTVTTPVLPDGQINNLCRPYGLVVAGLCSTTGATTDCWDRSVLSSIYPSFAENIPIPMVTPNSSAITTSATTALNNLDIATFIQEFNIIETAVLAQGATVPVTFSPIVLTGTKTVKPFANWFLLNISLRPGREVTLYNQTVGSVAVKERAVRELRARAEIANQVYNRLYNEIRVITRWDTTFSAYVGQLPTSSTTGLPISGGTPYIQTVLSQAVGSVNIPNGIPANAQWAGVDIHILPRKITQMLRSSLSELTGCTASSCTDSSMNGKGIFGYQRQARSPIKYIQGIGLGLIRASARYQNDIMGNHGLLMQDDKISQFAYAASSVTMAATAVGITALNVYPIVSWVRFANLIVYAASAVLMESYNYMSDLDQYALYKYEPLGSAISSLLLIWGGMFAAFLPAVPYMVVLFAIIGWIFLIIEAMFATPLIALGLTHPNSHQFLGASDQTLMMLFLLALRPVTIMIASFFAIFLCQNAVYFLNEGIILFMEVFFDVSASGANVSDFSALLFGLMLVYSYVLFVVLVQSFSIVGILPDKIGSWIGMGPMGGTNPLQQVMGIRSSFESSAQQGAQGASSTSRAKRVGHSGDGPDYAKINNADKAAERAGGYMDIRMSGSSGLRTIDNAKSDKAIERLTTGITGDAKKAAIKLLKTDTDPKIKREFLRECKKSGWRGQDTGKLNNILKDAKVDGYTFKTDSFSEMERVADASERDLSSYSGAEMSRTLAFNAMCQGRVTKAVGIMAGRGLTVAGASIGTAIRGRD